MSVVVGNMRKRLDELTLETMSSLKWMQESRVTREQAQIFTRHFGLFTRHSRQCWANVVGNCPIIKVRQFIVSENLYEEEANEETSHFNVLIKMGEALGLTQEQIFNVDPLHTTTVAFLAWETLTKNRSWIEAIAAKLILERSNEPHCGNMSAWFAQSWSKQLGLSAEDLEFFHLHVEADAIHGEMSLQILEQYADTPDKVEAAVNAAAQSLGAWKVMLDGIHTEAYHKKGLDGGDSLPKMAKAGGK